MKNTFKKVLLGVGISLMLWGCGVVKRQQERNDYPLGTSMKITCNIENARQYQVGQTGGENGAETGQT